jgi:HSP20 family protein
MYSLIKRNPALNLSNFFNDLEDEFYNLPRFYNRNLFSNYDYDEESKEYSIYMNIPGFKKEDISIRIENDYLIIEGNSKREKGKAFFNSSIQERTYVKDIDPESIDAELEDGILTVKYKTLENKNSKIIKIK